MADPLCPPLPPGEDETCTHTPTCPTRPTDPHDATERDADYGGIMCAECGWKLGGRDAHPDAAAQHRAHTQPSEPESE